MYEPQQGDLIWLNFTPSFGREMRGKHPALVVSSNAYNQKTNYIIVCPITSGGNDFSGYIPLHGYKIHGRVNATQIHSFDTDRIVSKEFIDRLRG
ncbi:type II toxin-antitoxin system PemK/MazF family toxin, partial [Enterococcus hirae]|nr:type II toxin-antitoxin system PemK/MazF family toxin [Enterococcus hirae]